MSYDIVTLQANCVSRAAGRPTLLVLRCRQVWEVGEIMVKLPEIRDEPVQTPEIMINTLPVCRQTNCKNRSRARGRKRPSAPSPTPVRHPRQSCCGWPGPRNAVTLIKSLPSHTPPHQTNSLFQCRSSDHVLDQRVAAPDSHSEQPPSLEHYAFTMPANPTSRQLRRYLRCTPKRSSLAGQI